MASEQENNDQNKLEIEYEISSYQFQLDNTSDKSLIEYYNIAIAQCKERLKDC